VLSADIEDAADIIKQALQLNPDLRVLARCAHLREVAALRRAGADFVAAGEAEVGVALTEAVISLGDKTEDDATQRLAAIRRQLYEPVIT
jgi:CPA2 family monovalent cation:H+ antiporter-2